MSKEIKDLGLSTRQLSVLRLVAEGLTVTEAAHRGGYCVEQVSRLHRSARGQAEIARLTEEAGLVLAAALPELVAEALDVVKERLRDSHGDRRYKAAELVLRYLAVPLIKATPNDENNSIIEMTDSPTQAKEADYDTGNT